MLLYTITIGLYFSIILYCYYYSLYSQITEYRNAYFCINCINEFMDQFLFL